MAGLRPSKRRHRLETDVELRLIPVMSLLVVLVPMLLQTAVFEQLAAVQLNLPSVDEVTFQADPSKEMEKDDSVTVAITSQGFRLISSEKTLNMLDKIDDLYDYKGLEKALADAKKKFPDQEAIILLIEDGVVYDDIIHTMDKCRPLFPGVSLAPSIQEPVEEEGG